MKENKEMQWQGEPVKVRFGMSTIRENKEKPMWWYNFECNMHQNDNGYYVPSYALSGVAVIPAIEVTQHGQTFVIANHFGIGYHKLINGGSPRSTHFSITEGKFLADDDFAIMEFNELGYSKHESERGKWQKENFPEEYEKLERLREAGRKLYNKAL